MVEQGKDVLCVPGSICSDSFRGSHKLLKMGAALVETAEDILEILSPVGTGSVKAGAAPESGLSASFSCPEEEEIFQALKSLPLSVEEVVQATGLDIRLINSKLSIMEIRGLVCKDSFSRYFLS